MISNYWSCIPIWFQLLWGKSVIVFVKERYLSFEREEFFLWADVLTSVGIWEEIKKNLKRNWEVKALSSVPWEEMERDCELLEEMEKRRERKNWYKNELPEFFNRRYSVAKL